MRAALPERLSAVLVAVHFAQAREVHFGSDDGVCRCGAVSLE